MDSPASVGYDKVVAIAVNKSKFSQAAVKWAIENLLVGGGSVIFLHVRSKTIGFDPKVSEPHYVRAFSGVDVVESLEEGYKESLDMQVRENLHSFTAYCMKRKVQSEMVILEDNDKAKAISDYVLANHIDLLVVGTGSSYKGVFKKFSGPDTAARISKKAPYFCTVYVVAKGILQSVRSASSTAHNLSGNEVKYLEYPKSHEPPIGQLSFTESSVTSRVALLQLDEASNFEFKSPLRNNGHSDFPLGRMATFESDISFVSNDRGTYHSSSPSRSSNCSDWSLGSFEPSYAVLSGISSFASRSESMGNNMADELQRLRLEMTNTKGVYEFVQDEVPEMNIQTNVEEHQGTNGTCRSARAITKFESKRL